MILGLRTGCYPVSDLAAGKAFYNAILSREPYFDQPFYVGYSVGGFELGLIPDGQPGATGSVAYWGVADIHKAYAAILGHGAKPHEEPKDVGGEIWVATVLDPFGNVFGLIQNPHFDPKAVG